MPVDRRSLLVGAAAAGLAPVSAWAAPQIVRSAAASPFRLGVASGDPLPDGFVLWTRLAPQPLAWDGSGGLVEPVQVDWLVASDEGLRNVVAKGREQADARLGHSVHAEVSGLKPDRPYWYAFTAQGHRSRTGMARTAPAPGQSPQRLRVVIASCAHWELGWFSAYRHMAAEQPDLILFLGDYIYEYSYRGERAAGRIVRSHDRPEDAADLAGYRNRYALYKTDADLQALHACGPCLMTWDDHEVQNDYAGPWSQFVDEPAPRFQRRRAAAYQAYYEHMPLRRRSIPQLAETRIYDRLRFGDLAEFTVLDGRQYRSVQPCGSAGSRRGHVAPETCADLTDPSRSLLGREQERWLYDGFKAGGARWNLIAQDVLVASVRQPLRDGGGLGHYTDGWDGYQANRDRMLAALQSSRLPNPVFLGGDIHSFWCTDLKADFRDPGSRTVATEFVGAAISQEGPPPNAFRNAPRLNPHIRYLDTATNGYMTLEVHADRLETRFQAISDRRDPQALVSTLQRFVVEDGRPGAVLA